MNTLSPITASGVKRPMDLVELEALPNDSLFDLDANFDLDSFVKISPVNRLSKCWKDTDVDSFIQFKSTGDHDLRDIAAFWVCFFGLNNFELFPTYSLLQAMLMIRDEKGTSLVESSHFIPDDPTLPNKKLEKGYSPNISTNFSDAATFNYESVIDLSDESGTADHPTKRGLFWAWFLTRTSVEQEKITHLTANIIFRLVIKKIDVVERVISQKLLGLFVTVLNLTDVNILEFPEPANSYLALVNNGLVKGIPIVSHIIAIYLKLYLDARNNNYIGSLLRAGFMATTASNGLTLISLMLKAAERLSITVADLKKITIEDSTRENWRRLMLYYKSYVETPHTDELAPWSRLLSHKYFSNLSIVNNAELACKFAGVICDDYHNSNSVWGANGFDKISEYRKKIGVEWAAMATQWAVGIGIKAWGFDLPEPIENDKHSYKRN